jgi:hypothetical protein
MNALELEIRNCNNLRSVNLLADDVRFHSQYGWGNQYTLQMEERREEIKRECARRGRFNPAGHNPWR